MHPIVERLRAQQTARRRNRAILLACVFPFGLALLGEAWFLVAPCDVLCLVHNAGDALVRTASNTWL